MAQKKTTKRKTAKGRKPATRKPAARKTAAKRKPVTGATRRPKAKFPGWKEPKGPSEQDLKDARKGGFKGRKPSKKNVKTLAQIEKYVGESFPAWTAKVQAHAAAYRQSVAAEERRKVGKKMVAGL